VGTIGWWLLGWGIAYGSKNGTDFFGTSVARVPCHIMSPQLVLWFLIFETCHFFLKKSSKTNRSI
jgi:hypothetical protein